MLRWSTVALGATLCLSMPSPVAAQDAPAGGDKVDFVKQVQPIFRDRCFKCHGAKKVEGEVRLDLKKYAFGDDEDLWVIIPGEPDDSSLVERIALPHDDPDIMPNEGEPLTKDQIAIIRTWVEEGADWPAEADRAIVAELDRRRQREEINVREMNEEEAGREKAALASLSKTGALAMRVAQNTSAVEVNFSLLGPKVTDAHLDGIRGLEPTLVWLNLARTGVTDAGMKTVGDFIALRRLNLSNTAITDAGLQALAGLSDLEYLNLYGTKITNAGLAHLRGLGKLQKLFVWQTGVDAEGAAGLRESLPGVRVDLGDYAKLMAQPATPAPINQKCPVSGQPVDAAKTVEFEGQRVGFCCDKCKAKFEKDPTSFVAKIENFKPQVAAAPAKKPVNVKCPVSGQPIDAEFTSTFEGKLVAFCCGKCKAKFDKAPAKFAAKIEAAAPAATARSIAAAAAAPVNAKCPVSGQPIDAEFTSTFEGKLVAFCCGKCKAKFDKAPAKFAAKIEAAAPAATARSIAAAAAAPVNAKCPVSGQPIDAEFTSTFEGKLVAFCCGKCKAKFDKAPAKFAAKIEAAAPAATARSIAAAAAAPVNAKCPVSGQPIDAEFTSTFEGKLVAFCCGKCKAKFDKAPAKFAAKIEAAAPAATARSIAAAAAAPVNAKCPVSGQPIDAEFTSTFEGKLVAFCCGKCKAKFDKAPAKFAAKIEAAAPAATARSIAAAAAAPVNAKCPFSGRDVDPTTAFEVQGKLVAFCCNNCRTKFAAEPERYVAKVPELQGVKK